MDRKLSSSKYLAVADASTCDLRERVGPPRRQSAPAVHFDRLGRGPAGGRNGYAATRIFSAREEVSCGSLFWVFHCPSVGSALRRPRPYVVHLPLRSSALFGTRSRVEIRASGRLQGGASGVFGVSRVSRVVSAGDFI